MDVLNESSHSFPFISIFVLHILDMDGNVNEWNNKTAEITGFTKEEALNRPLVTTFIMPKLRRSVQEVMDNALQGNETSNYELGESSISELPSIASFCFPAYC